MSKQVLAIHDLACYGKCALTIVLPVLSASGLSTSVLPTALLSTHTGGYGKPYMRDLKEDMKTVLQHFHKQGIAFDAIYSGYVSTISQAKQIEMAFEQYPNAFHMVDPVMGDHGTLYSSLPAELPNAMRSLCAKADLITPNMTEAYALIKEPYQEGPYTKAEIERVCHALSNHCKGDILLTSIYFGNDDYGTTIYQRNQNLITYEMRKRLSSQSHGTGDLFSSCVLGAYLNGCTQNQAVRLATDYVMLTLETTFAIEHDERQGLLFEQHLTRFVECIKESKDI